ncbi:hypothetical protein KUL42_38960 [Alteromonas sp. KUL42]|uniref:hypothetical protein n=1 Tax=Alteromonas sp. KUL42 TaxID=2480797 RepID=UPI0010359F57|nr:hypothetical protein [Alteromonas sp. KUL42]TAP31703.1 hypothetical protein EYR97_19635 [Alteromonas sp. KUL42]GEA09135.1 hypothetical protein KUL42_38960 [Alteromonas sp. KUL42]
MQSVKPSNKSFLWVISPYREKFNSGAVRAWLQEHAKSYHAKYVCLKDGHCAFSIYEGIDFGRTLTVVRSSKNYLYIESRQEGYVFVHVKNGNLIEDRIIQEQQGLVDSLRLLIGLNGHSSSVVYDVEHYGLEHATTILEYIEIITGEEGSCSELSSSLFDSLDISSLSPNEVYEFVDVDAAFRTLSDSKTQKLTASVVAFIALMLFLWTNGFFETKKLVERVQLIDEFSDFTTQLTSKSALSSRLVQDYSIHKLIKSELKQWALYKVTHEHESIRYSVIKITHLSTLREVYKFAQKYGMAVVTQNGAVELVAGIVHEPIFQSEEEVRRYDLDDVTVNIVDTLAGVTPFAGVEIMGKTVNRHWSSQVMGVKMKVASPHELMRVAAVVDGYPAPYPIYYSYCDGRPCSYDVSPNGEIKGEIRFTVVGISEEENS